MSERANRGKHRVVPEHYWQSRLERHFDARGVGNIGLRSAYNGWLYRLKGRVFRRQVRTHLPKPAAAEVLDIGSGTGFVIEQWRRMGCRRIVGSDLTRKSIAELQARHPEIEFAKIDIGAHRPPALDRYEAAFDAVSMLDVAYHLMTDEAYRSALANVAHTLKPGGIFLFSEYPTPSEETRRGHHTVFRPWSQISSWLDEVGFEVVSRRPQYVFMERPTRFGLGLPALSWRLVSRLARSSDVGAWLTGAVLMPVDLLATRLVRNGPSVQIIACRRRSD